MKQGKRKLFMPSGRASADRRIIGCWLYQKGAVIFIGERQPYYWINLNGKAVSIEAEGVEWWCKHFRRKQWETKTGWTNEEIERDFRALVKAVFKK